MINDIREIVKTGYERGNYAGLFRTSTNLKEIENKFLGRLSTLLTKNARILDLGCGNGIPFDIYLCKKGFQITGIDFALNYIIAARRNVPGATFIKGDFSTTDFGGNPFQAILAFYSIFHIPKEEHRNLFDKIYKSLENGGYILVTLGTFSGDGLEENWAGSKMAWSSHNPSNYKKIFTQVGFQIIESEYEGQPGDQEHHWWVLARKK